jgi:hypothetical protein
MNKPTQSPDTTPELEQEQKGPNLILLYALLALALLGAMTFAAMIVWPFYLRR